jgi:hypothetical protein
MRDKGEGRGNILGGSQERLPNRKPSEGLPQEGLGGRASYPTKGGVG